MLKVKVVACNDSAFAFGLVGSRGGVVHRCNETNFLHKDDSRLDQRDQGLKARTLGRDMPWIDFFLTGLMGLISFPSRIPPEALVLPLGRFSTFHKIKDINHN